MYTATSDYVYLIEAFWMDLIGRTERTQNSHTFSKLDHGCDRWAAQKAIQTTYETFARNKQPLPSTFESIAALINPLCWHCRGDVTMRQKRKRQEDLAVSVGSISNR